MKVIWSNDGERPHFATDCWCQPYACPDCGRENHRQVQLTRDVQPRMAMFSDQRIPAEI